MVQKDLIIAGFYPFPHSNGIYHDVNAAIASVSEGTVSLFAYEEEKLSRLKYDYLSRFPDRSFLCGCKELGIDPEDVDVVVTAKPFGVDRDYLISTIFHGQYKMRKEVKIIELPHHYSHIGYAVYGSGAGSGIFLSADGGGDEADPRQLVWGIFENGKIEEKGCSSGNGAFAYLHHLMTEAVGFTMLENGKSMGLGSYGKLVPEIKQFINSRLSRVDDLYHQLTFRRSQKSHSRMHKLNRNAFNRFSVTRSPEGFTDFYDFCRAFPGPDIAFTVQAVLEEYLLEFLGAAIARSGRKLDSLVLAGGFFQNILANRAVWRMRAKLGVSRVYVPAGAGDSGNALGLLLYAMHNELGLKNAKLPRDEDGNLTPFLGPSFSAKEFVDAANEFADIVSLEEKGSEDELIKDTVDHLVAGKVVGWFQGRGEIGPRSLLARSVIADPRKAATKDRVNQLLKKREWFMPYAPAVIRESGGEFFDDYTPSPYMTMAFDVKKDKAALIPAALHVDGTARPNSVSKTLDPRSYKLLKEFEAKTGIPLILNTSFNRHGIPTISTPEHAIDHLVRGNIDLLVMGNLLLKKGIAKERVAQEAIVPTSVFISAEYLKPYIREAYFGTRESFQSKFELMNRSLRDGLAAHAISEPLSVQPMKTGFEVRLGAATVFTFESSRRHAHVDLYFTELVAGLKGAWPG